MSPVQALVMACQAYILAAPRDALWYVVYFLYRFALWVNGSLAVKVGNTVFVDAVFGSDISGLVERLDKPFASVQAALTAANTAGLFEPTIKIAPGRYDGAVTVPPAMECTLLGDNSATTTLRSTGSPTVTWHPPASDITLTLRNLSLTELSSSSQALLVSQSTGNNTAKLVLQDVTLDAAGGDDTDISRIGSVELRDVTSSTSLRIHNVNVGNLYNVRHDDLILSVAPTPPPQVGHERYSLYNCGTNPDGGGFGQLVHVGEANVYCPPGNRFANYDATTLAGGDIVFSTKCDTFSFASNVHTNVFQLHQADIGILEASYAGGALDQTIDAAGAIIGLFTLESTGGQSLILDTRGGTVRDLASSTGDADSYQDRESGGQVDLDCAATGGSAYRFGVDLPGLPFPPGVDVSYVPTLAQPQNAVNEYPYVQLHNNEGCDVANDSAGDTTIHLVFNRVAA